MLNPHMCVLRKHRNRASQCGSERVVLCQRWHWTRSRAPQPVQLLLQATAWRICKLLAGRASQRAVTWLTADGPKCPVQRPPSPQSPHASAGSHGYVSRMFGNCPHAAFGSGVQVCALTANRITRSTVQNAHCGTLVAQAGVAWCAGWALATYCSNQRLLSPSNYIFFGSLVLTKAAQCHFERPGPTEARQGHRERGRAAAQTKSDSASNCLCRCSTLSLGV